MENKIKYSLLAASLLLMGWFVYADNTSSIRVMSYNIRREGSEKKEERLWVNRLPLIAAILNMIKPDIIGFQEVINHQKDDLQKKLQILP